MRQTSSPNDLLWTPAPQTVRYRATVNHVRRYTAVVTVEAVKG